MKMLAAALVLSLSANAAFAGGPVIVEEEAQPEVIAESPRLGWIVPVVVGLVCFAPSPAAGTMTPRRAETAARTPTEACAARCDAATGRDDCTAMRSFRMPVARASGQSAVIKANRSLWGVRTGRDYRARCSVRAGSPR